MKTKEQIISTILSHKTQLTKLGIREIGLFGSYVRNENTPASDIDLLIDFEKEKETFDNFMATCDLLESLFADEKIEVVTKKGLSPYIGPKILEEVEYVK
jgi:predicted nucleotidyltransferase